MTTMRRLRLFALTVAGALLASAPAPAAEPGGDFAAWLDGVRAEARARGIAPETLDSAFAGLAPIDRVLELDRRQPEFTRSFWDYLDRAVSDTRVETGRAMLERHGDLLGRVAARHGVQPRFLVAFWGLETNYGDYLGGFPVIGALATLAHDPRRADFFRAELMHALSILEAKDVRADDMQGSWAGAMGQPQFMPSTFVAYALDADGDGRRDIWRSHPDIFASAANFLSQVGWNGEETWGREVRLPADFDFNAVGLETRRHIHDWRAIGLRRADGRDLPRADIEGSVLVPAGASGPAFLVYGNYRVILRWNRSHLYAIAVGHLADRLVGLPPLAAPRPPDDQRLSRDQVMALQAGLNRLGYDAGPVDGILGSGTRAALRDWQRANGLPPDGFPTPALADRLGGEGG